MIQIENISKVFRTTEVETVALNHVNLEVKEGEFVAIMGPSGCGTVSYTHLVPCGSALVQRGFDTREQFSVYGVAVVVLHKCCLLYTSCPRRSAAKRERTGRRQSTPTDVWVVFS